MKDWELNLGIVQDFLNFSFVFVSLALFFVQVCYFGNMLITKIKFFIAKKDLAIGKQCKCCCFLVFRKFKDYAGALFRAVATLS